MWTRHKRAWLPPPPPSLTCYGFAPLWSVPFSSTAVRRSIPPSLSTCRIGSRGYRSVPFVLYTQYYVTTRPLLTSGYTELCIRRAELCSKTFELKRSTGLNHAYTILFQRLGHVHTAVLSVSETDHRLLGHLKNIPVYLQKPSAEIQWGRAHFWKSESLILYSSTELGVTQLFKKWHTCSYIIMKTVRSKI